MALQIRDALCIGEFTERQQTGKKCDAAEDYE
jgi:hypothetical protein